jgi:hypothetical protein
MNFTLIAKETVPHKAKYSLVPVTVYIRDMNDNFPEFTQLSYEVKFSTYVYTLSEYSPYKESGVIDICFTSSVCKL